MTSKILYNHNLSKTNVLKM